MELNVLVDAVESFPLSLLATGRSFSSQPENKAAHALSIELGRGVQLSCCNGDRVCESYNLLWTNGSRIWFNGFPSSEIPLRCETWNLPSNI